VLVDAHAHVLPGDYPPAAPDCFPRMEPIDGSTARTLVFASLRFRARDVFFAAERRVEAAAAELAAIGGLGLRGVEIASNVLDTPIGDERFLPFFAEAERLGLAIFVHAMPSAGGGLPAQARGTYAVGVQGALAAASLVTGGTAAKCPDLRISFSHGAGGYPLIIPRAQYFWSGAWNEEPVVAERAVMHDDGPSPFEYARRFYYDSLVFDRRALRYLIDALGADRLLVGSDFPAMLREEPAGRTLRSMNLPPEVIEDITWNNAFRWLGITPTR
jgi:aminocarboxymuconate-semialdehyde decarboxylase